MLQPGCDGLAVLPSTPLPTVIASLPEAPWYVNPAIWFWIGVIVAVAAVEWWAWRHHRQTPSQWLRKQAARFKWFQAFGTALFVFLIYHFFYSGSLKDEYRNEDRP